MSKVKWKGGALMAPIPPAMVSCMGANGKPNIITVAWTGILCTHPPKTYISVRPERYSYSLIKESGEFIINLTNKSLIREADFCGMRTGRKIDKFAVLGLTPAYDADSGFRCPAIAESPLSLYCKVERILTLGSHDMFIADIVQVSVDEALIDSAGRLRMDQAGLAAFTHGEYFELGKKLGSFGFSVAKKKKRALSSSVTKKQKKEESPAVSDKK